MTAPIETCGNCKYSRIKDAANLMLRVCKGGPPQVVIVPKGNQLVAEIMWPNVNAAEEGCGLWKPKLSVVGGGGGQAA